MVKLIPKITKSFIAFLTKFFHISWKVFFWVNQTATNISHPEFSLPRPKLVLFLSKIFALILGLVAIFDIYSNVESDNELSRKRPNTCNNQRPMPTMLICPKPFDGRKYGLYANEDLIRKLNFSDSEVDVLADWQMTGNYPKNEEAQLLLEKAEKEGFTSLESLWEAATDLETDFFDQRVSCIAAGHNETGTKRKCPDNVFNYKGQRKRNDIYWPVFEKFRSNSTFQYRRRIWNKVFKSRCVFMERHTHMMTGWMITRVNPWYPMDYWVWFGDLQVTNFTEDSYIDLKFGTIVRVETEIYEVNQSAIGIPTVCHQELVYDGGEQYPCPKNKETHQYWVYDPAYKFSRANLHQLTFVAWSKGFKLSETKTVGSTSQLLLAWGVVDLAIGFSMFYIFSLLISRLQKFNRLRLALKCTIVLLLISVAAYLVHREYNDTIEKRYSKSIVRQRFDNADVPVIDFSIRSMFNFTKLNELGISIPLLFYATIAARGFVHHSWDPSFRVHDQVQENDPFSAIVTECLSNHSAGNKSLCRFNSKFHYNPFSLFNLLFRYAHDKENFTINLDALNSLYGERYSSAYDHHSLMAILQGEYDELGKKLDTFLQIPEKIMEHIQLDPCQFILSCSNENHKVASCCDLFSPDGFIGLSPSHFRLNPLHGLVSQKPGLKKGFTVEINFTALHYHSDMIRWNKSFVLPEVYCVSDQNSSQCENCKVCEVKKCAKAVHYPCFQNFSFQIFVSHNSPLQLNEKTRPRRYDQQYTIPEHVFWSDNAWVNGIGLDLGYIYDAQVKRQDCGEKKFAATGGIRNCLSQEIVKQHLLVKACKCRKCNDFWYKSMWPNVPCCTVEQFFDCTTAIGFYKTNCKEAEATLQIENVLWAAELFDLMRHFKACKLRDWIKPDDRGNLSQYLNSTNLLELNSHLVFDFYNVTTDSFACPPTYDYACELEEAQFSRISEPEAIGQPGVLKLNFYLSSMEKLVMLERETYYPFQMVAIFFGSWAVCFNEPILLMILTFVVFFKRIVLVFRGLLPVSTFFTDSAINMPTNDQVVKTQIKKSSALIPSISYAIQPPNKVEEVSGCSIKISPNTVATVQSVEKSKPSEVKVKKNSSANKNQVAPKPVSTSMNLSAAYDKQAKLHSEYSVTLGKYLVKLQGALFWIFTVIFIAASSSFIDESINSKPYVYSMEISNTANYPIPSVALCTESHERVRNIVDNVFGECRIHDNLEKCTDLFKVYYRAKMGLMSCIVTDNSRTNANIKQLIWEEQRRSSFQWVLKAISQSHFPQKIYVWVGDIGAVSEQHPIASMFEWKFNTSMMLRFNTRKVVEPRSLCHDSSTFITDHLQCSQMEKNNKEHSCSLKEKLKFYDLARLEKQSSVPCSMFSFDVWEVKNSPSNESTWELKLQKWKSFVITYIRKDRFSLSGVLIFLSTYWGMFYGITLYQILVLLLHAVISAKRRLTKSQCTDKDDGTSREQG